MKFEIPTKEIAMRIGVCASRVRQRARELEDAGVARKLAGRWLFSEEAVDVWRSWKESAK
jgi:hypothetical protein